MQFDNRLFRAERHAAEPESSHPADGDSPSVGFSSPGKRKFDDLQMTPDSSPTGNVNVMERELRGSDDSTWEGGLVGDQQTTNGNAYDVIVGVDPSLLTKHGDDPKVEMTERSGLPMLSRPNSNARPSSTIDCMDLDQVVEDEDVTKESAAVKQVGFTDREMGEEV